MIALKDGYLYEVENFNKGEDTNQVIRFAEPKLKKNGTTTEELMRVLIHRLTVLDGGANDQYNQESIKKMKESLWWQQERIRNKKKNDNNNIRALDSHEVQPSPDQKD